MTGAFILFILLAIVLAALQETPPPEEVSRSVSPLPPRRVRLSSPPAFDSESYYRTIIENNLFRPLGWTPPRPTEPYRLIGTILPTDDRRPPSAILQTTTGNPQTYIVSTSEKLDGSTEVVSIQGKAVTLSTVGQTRTLKLTATHWLNPSRVSPRFTSQRQTPVRPPQGVRRTPTRAPTDSPSSSPSPPPPDRTFPLSQWQTREGEAIRLDDARLKNPAKWGLRRR